jgi:hypothetical protein
MQTTAATHASPLQRLADVELALIMQQLSAVELLQFARCSRQLMYAADNAFGWRHVLLRLNSAQTPPAPLHSMRLLRHAPTALTWSPCSQDEFERQVAPSLSSHPLASSCFDLSVNMSAFDTKSDFELAAPRPELQAELQEAEEALQKAQQRVTQATEDPSATGCG